MPSAPDAVLQKVYGSDPQGQKRWSPSVCLGTETRAVSGNPDKNPISTSHVGRQNLTMRMGMRRFTRLTNGCSKKAENLAAAVSLHFMHYNFAQPHKSLSKPYPKTPAMAAGVTTHPYRYCGIAGFKLTHYQNPTALERHGSASGLEQAGCIYAWAKSSAVLPLMLRPLALF